MKKILVPTDFSRQAGFALTAAHQLARKWDATLVLFHVIQFPLEDEEYPINRIFSEAADYLKKAREEANELMREEAQKHQVTDVKIIYRTEIGAPYRFITKELIHGKIDLVVMGSKGASGLKEIFIGSNAERMVRFAPCPVMVIKNKVDLNRIDHIVFATSLHENEERILPQLQKFQQVYQAHIHLLRVNTIANFLYDTEVKKSLDKIAKAHNLKNYSIHTFNDLGEEEGILHFADEVKADMIALATHGHRGIAHLLSGSVTEDLVNHSSKPIWTMSLRES